MGSITNMTHKENIIHLVRKGHNKTQDLQWASDAAPSSVNVFLTELVQEGRLVRLDRGFYEVPENLMWVRVRRDNRAIEA